MKVTNLLDETQFPTEDFLDIYHMRWGIEDAILKTRLNLENFSGKTAQSIYQVLVYLTGLEAILTAGIDEQQKNLLKILKKLIVLFLLIRLKAVELLCSNEESDVVIKRLEKLFLTNPVSIREQRKVPRNKRSAWHRTNYLKRKQKFTF
jgi:hypothetical protein